MMKKLNLKMSIVFLTICLSGCMASSLESQNPIYNGHSNKSVDAINRCIAPKWVELRPSTTSIPTETGYKVIASDDLLGALAIAKIDSSSSGGSDVKVYAVARGFKDPWATPARECMK